VAPDIEPKSRDRTQFRRYQCSAIGAAQNFPNRNAVSAESFSDALGLLYTAGRKVCFLGAVPGRESPYSFSDVDVAVAQQDNLAALL
jgi:hypothetical protein